MFLTCTSPVNTNTPLPMVPPIPMARRSKNVSLSSSSIAEGLDILDDRFTALSSSRGSPSPSFNIFSRGLRLEIATRSAFDRLQAAGMSSSVDSSGPGSLPSAPRLESLYRNDILPVSRGLLSEDDC